MKQPAPKVARCGICGNTDRIQMNHLGGKYHVAWFMMAFCTPCHNRFHAMVRQAGILLEFTSNKVERTRRALAAIKIAEWMLLEQLKHDPNSEGTNQ